MRLNVSSWAIILYLYFGHLSCWSLSEGLIPRLSRVFTTSICGGNMILRLLSSKTRETLLWVLCSCRSYNSQTILRICWIRLLNHLLWHNTLASDSYFANLISSTSTWFQVVPLCCRTTPTLPQRAASWRAVPRAVLTLMSSPTRSSSSTTLQAASTTSAPIGSQTWCVHSCWPGATECACRSSSRRPCTFPPAKLPFTNTKSGQEPI